MNGGPSHVDTFDPKPLLEKYHGKTAAHPQPTHRAQDRRGAGLAVRVPEVRRERHRGQRAVRADGRQHIDDLCIIRSMYADVPNHEPSLMLMNCGDGRLQRPSMGAWITYGLGSENQNLPGFIAMCPGGYPIVATQNWRSAFLPGAYQGTYIDTQHTDIDKLIENIRNATYCDRRSSAGSSTWCGGSTSDHAAARAARPGARGADPVVRAGLPHAERGGRGLRRQPASPSRSARSTAPGTQARQLLITRRLLERGVRFIQVWSGAGQPWDDHENIAAAPPPARRRVGPGHRRVPDRSQAARAV